MKSIIIIFILISLFSGCRSIESTTRHYRSVSPELYPPKPNNILLPILNPGKTRRAYKIIGIMEFESGASEKFIMDSVQYNGRINGADAIILKEWKKEQNSYVSYYPLRVGWSYHNGYHCDNGIYWSNIYTAPYYETQTYITHRVKAEMIIFLDKETFGYLGFVFEDTINTKYLEIGQVIVDSPAYKAGFKKGDRITKINDYTCDKGLEDFHKNSPVFEVGKSYDVSTMRNGIEEKISIIAEKIKTN